MADSSNYQRKIRRSIRRNGVAINVAADINVAASRGGSRSSVQRTSIVQTPAGAPSTPGEAPEREEQEHG